MSLALALPLSFPSGSQNDLVGEDGVTFTPRAIASVDTSPAGMDFDYFANNWNVVGLKDYVHGSRITPDNEHLLRSAPDEEHSKRVDRSSANLLRMWAYRLPTGCALGASGVGIVGHQQSLHTEQVGHPGIGQSGCCATQCHDADQIHRFLVQQHGVELDLCDHHRTVLADGIRAEQSDLSAADLAVLGLTGCTSDLQVPYLASHQTGDDDPAWHPEATELLVTGVES